MRKIILGGLLLSGLLAAAGTGQTPQPAAKPAEPKKDPLEDDIARALRTHPDVMVAEAEAQLANAKVQQVRLALAQKVAAAKRDKELAKATVVALQKQAEAEAKAAAAPARQLEAVKRQKANNIVSELEVQTAEQAVEKARVQVLQAEQAVEAAKAKAAAADAEYEGLIGKTASGRVGAFLDVSQVYLNGQTYGRVVVNEVYAEVVRQPATEPKPGSVAEKLRTDLGKSVTFECTRQTLMMVAHDLKTLSGTTLMIRVPDGLITTLTFDKHSLPLAAWLDLVRDEFNLSSVGLQRPYEWYVREYGLLFSAAGRPEGAMTLGEFLKATAAEKKPDAPKK